MDAVVVAQFGQIHSEVAAARKLRQDVFLAEFDLEALYELGPPRGGFVRSGKYPAVERDFSLSFLTPSRSSRCARLWQNWSSPSCGSFVRWRFFGAGRLGPGKYSVLLRVRFQSAERTLREDEVAGWSGKIVGALAGLGGVQRGSERIREFSQKTRETGHPTWMLFLSPLRGWS